jgi:hypothetical protein
MVCHTTAEAKIEADALPACTQVCCQILDIAPAKQHRRLIVQG